MAIILPTAEEANKLVNEIYTLEELKILSKKFEKYYAKIFPKVDPKLVKDLLLRQTENLDKTPLYTLEVFTKKAVDPESIREHIWNTTGTMPGIYDNGTHYVTNQKLTLETLKKLNDFDHVLEVTGEYAYNGSASIGPVHERRIYVLMDDDSQLEAQSHQKKKEQQQQLKPKVPQELGEESKSSRIEGKKVALKTVICTIIGIVSAVALAGFIISGGIPPNANTNSIVANTLSSPALWGLEPAILHGFVGGSVLGLPTIGASVVAVNQETDYTANSIISIDGKYYLDIPPGKYNIIVAFPDGTSKVYEDISIERGTANKMDFKY